MFYVAIKRLQCDLFAFLFGQIWWPCMCSYFTAFGRSNWVNSLGLFVCFVHPYLIFNSWDIDEFMLELWFREKRLIQRYCFLWLRHEEKKETNHFRITVPGRFGILQKINTSGGIHKGCQTSSFTSCSHVKWCTNIGRTHSFFLEKLSEQGQKQYRKKVGLPTLDWEKPVD